MRYFRLSNSKWVELPLNEWCNIEYGLKPIWLYDNNLNKYGIGLYQYRIITILKRWLYSYNNKQVINMDKLEKLDNLQQQINILLEKGDDDSFKLAMRIKKETDKLMSEIFTFNKDK